MLKRRCLSLQIINLESFESSEDFKPHKLIQQKEVEIVLLAFAPGQGLPVHTTPVDVFFQVIKGKADIKIGEEEKVVQEGRIVVSPAEIPHTVKNNSEEEIKVLVIKTPKP